MPDEKVILVTGVSGFWGSQVASKLLSDLSFDKEHPIHVIGLDIEPPSPPIEGLDFIQADVRNPYLSELLRREQVDTVCHLAFKECVKHTEANFDLNVMGTMKLLGACSEAGVRKVVLKSSTTVYGAYPSNPAFITEEQEVEGVRKSGTNRHLLEIESFCNGFRRQQPDLILTILRYPNIIGLRCDTPMTRFLKQPTAPVLMGFDPRMQIIHEKDVVNSLAHAVLNDKPGVYNIAAEEVMTLRRITGLAAKITFPIFHPLAYGSQDIINNLVVEGLTSFPIELDFLRYECVGDLEKMHTEFDFKPSYTAIEALREFAGEQRLRRYITGEPLLEYDQERLKDTLDRRQRERELADQSEVKDE